MSHLSCSNYTITGNEKRLNGSHLLQIEEKSGQMLGATVRVSKKGDSVVVRISYVNFYSHQ